MSNTNSRLRRARKTRARIFTQGDYRLSVYKTPQHIYAQIISPFNEKIITAASTVQSAVKEKIDGHTGNIDAARIVGALIAEKAKDAGVETVAFDRSGFKYHGRVKALADAARENGLKF